MHFRGCKAPLSIVSGAISSDVVNGCAWMKPSGLGPGTIASGKILGLIDGRRVRGREHYTLMPFDLYIKVTEFCNIL